MDCSKAGMFLDLSHLKLYLLFLIVANAAFFVLSIRKQLAARRFTKRTYTTSAQENLGSLGSILKSGTKLYNVIDTEVFCPRCQRQPVKKKVFLKLRKRYKINEKEDGSLVFKELTDILHCPQCSYKGLAREER